MISLKRVFWALRKLKLPIRGNGLVLDLGSGGNPYPRADVLLDRLGGAEHRSGVAMKIDRLAILGDATKLPFKDKSFDFVIASHVFEHMPNPEIFLQEMQRVGKAGYIETPNILCERLTPCDAHCLEIALVDGVLRIKKKAGPIEDAFLKNLNYLQSDVEWAEQYHSNPSLFHIKYHWNDSLEWLVVNPEISCDWVEEIYKLSESSEATSIDPTNTRKGWRKLGISLLEMYHTKRRIGRLRNFDVFSILACPECKGILTKSVGRISCVSCNTSYSSSPYIDFERALP